MNLFEYIKSQLPKVPNASIMKNMGASDELVEYVKKTPWNTNLGMMETLGCGDESQSSGEVWYTGTLGECQNGQAVATVSETDKAKTTDLATSPTNYDVSMNGNTLQYWAEESSSDSVAFIDDETEPNYVVMIAYGADGFMEGIVYIKCPTDITTVEVTVAKK